MNAAAEEFFEFLDDPEELEAFYREDPDTFHEGLTAALAADPESATLRVWRARLEYRKPDQATVPRRLPMAIGIALAFGALFRFPAIGLGEEWYYPRLAPSLIMLALAAYFWIDQRDRRLLSAGAALSLVAIGYVSVAFAGKKNPFTDRDFLITFNGLLLVVLLIAAFSIVERSEASQTGIMDYINLALVGVTLLINVVALTAMLFRLASYGFTPNRVTVLGANVVIMGHLTWLGWTNVRFVRKRVELGAMRRVAVSYLPVYAAWAVVVTFLLPLVFGFA